MIGGAGHEAKVLPNDSLSYRNLLIQMTRKLYSHLLVKKIFKHFFTQTTSDQSFKFYSDIRIANLLKILFDFNLTVSK